MTGLFFDRRDTFFHSEILGPGISCTYAFAAFASIASDEHRDDLIMPQRLYTAISCSARRTPGGVVEGAAPE